MIKNRRHFQKTKGLSGVYQWLTRHKPELLERHLPSKRTAWNTEMCLSSAKNYSSKIKWLYNDGAAYQASKKLGCFNQCTNHMINNTPTKKECVAAARKCTTRNEFQKRFKKYYAIAQKNKWLDDCYSHMPRALTNPKKVKNLDTGKIFPSLFATGICAANICRAIKNNLTAGGYRWAYCDEKGNVLK